MHELDKSKNENGNSLYPKLVYPHGPAGDAIKVMNYQHEKEVMGAEEVKKPAVDMPTNEAPKTAW